MKLFGKKKEEPIKKRLNQEEIERLEAIRNVTDPASDDYGIIQKNIESLRKEQEASERPKKKERGENGLKADTVVNCGTAVLQTVMVLFGEPLVHISQKGFSTIKKPR